MKIKDQYSLATSRAILNRSWKFQTTYVRHIMNNESYTYMPNLRSLELYFVGGRAVSWGTNPKNWENHQKYRFLGDVRERKWCHLTKKTPSKGVLMKKNYRREHVSSILDAQKQVFIFSFFFFEPFILKFLCYVYWSVLKYLLRAPEKDTSDENRP